MNQLAEAIETEGIWGGDLAFYAETREHEWKHEEDANFQVAEDNGAPGYRLELSLSETLVRDIIAAINALDTPTASFEEFARNALHYTSYAIQHQTSLDWLRV